VRGLQAPQSVKQVQRFLALTGHFPAFIKDYAKVASPLITLTQKGTDFAWGPDQEEAFEKLKYAITLNPVLTLPDFSKSFILTTDASDRGTGAVLTQKHGRKEQVIGYHSYTLSKLLSILTVLSA